MNKKHKVKKMFQSIPTKYFFDVSLPLYKLFVTRRFLLLIRSQSKIPASN